MRDKKAQPDKFKEGVRELGCDEEEGRWQGRLGKVTPPKAPENDRETFKP
jgi:hypothetical protein